MPRQLLLFALAGLACAALCPAIAHADDGRVHLRDGGVVSGDIMLHRPGVETRVRLSDGSSVTLSGDEVARVEFDQTELETEAAPLLTAEDEVENLRLRMPTRRGPGFMTMFGALGLITGGIMYGTDTLPHAHVAMALGAGLLFTGLAIFLPIRNARIRRWQQRIDQLELRLNVSEPAAYLGGRLYF